MLKKILSDNGTEMKGPVQEWCSELGVERLLTTPYSPQQNGRVERWHRTMAEGMRTLLLPSGGPASLWAEALHHVAWVKNRLPHSAHPGGETPYQLMTGKLPDFTMIRVWGCMCCSLLNTPAQQGKLAPRGQMLVLLGMAEESKGWRVLDPETQHVHVARNI